MTVKTAKTDSKKPLIFYFDNYTVSFKLNYAVKLNKKIVLDFFKLDIL